MDLFQLRNEFLYEITEFSVDEDIGILVVNTQNDFFYGVLFDKLRAKRTKRVISSLQIIRSGLSPGTNHKQSSSSNLLFNLREFD